MRYMKSYLDVLCSIKYIKLAFVTASMPAQEETADVVSPDGVTDGG